MDGDECIFKWLDMADRDADLAFGASLPGFVNQLFDEIASPAVVERFIEASSDPEAEQAFEDNLPQFKKNLLAAIHGGDGTDRGSYCGESFQEAAERFEEFAHHSALSKKLKESARHCCALLSELHEAVLTCTPDDDDDASAARIAAAFVRAEDLRQEFESKIVDTLEQFLRAGRSLLSTLEVIFCLETAVRAYFRFLGQSLGVLMPTVDYCLLFLCEQTRPHVLQLLPFHGRAIPGLLQPGATLNELNKQSI